MAQLTPGAHAECIQPDGATVKYVPAIVVANKGGTISVQLCSDAVNDQQLHNKAITLSWHVIRPAPPHKPCGSNCEGRSLDVQYRGAWVRVLAVGRATDSAGMSVIYEGESRDTISCS